MSETGPHHNPDIEEPVDEIATPEKELLSADEILMRCHREWERIRASSRDELKHLMSEYNAHYNVNVDGEIDRSLLMSIHQDNYQDITNLANYYVGRAKRNFLIAENRSPADIKRWDVINLNRSLKQRPSLFLSTEEKTVINTIERIRQEAVLFIRSMISDLQAEAVQQTLLHPVDAPLGANPENLVRPADAGNLQEGSHSLVRPVEEEDNTTNKEE